MVSVPPASHCGEAGGTTQFHKVVVVYKEIDPMAVEIRDKRTLAKKE